MVDNQGRTPLDVCTENKSNEWKETEQILKSNIPHEEHVRQRYTLNRCYWLLKVDATTVRVVRLPSIQIDEDEDEENEIVAYEDEDNENEVVKYEDEGTENEVVKLSLLSKYEVDLTLRGSLIDIIDDDDKEEELPLPPRIVNIGYSFVVFCVVISYQLHVKLTSASWMVSIYWLISIKVKKLCLLKF